MILRASFFCPADFSLSSDLKSSIKLKRQTKVCRTLSVFLGAFRSSLHQFLVPATFTLPQRIDGVRIGGVLINRAVGRDNLSATARAGTPAGGPLPDINI